MMSDDESDPVTPIYTRPKMAQFLNNKTKYSMAWVLI
jgi:hypothetical protein